MDLPRYIRYDMIMTHDSTILLLKGLISLVTSVMGVREWYYLLACGSQQPFAPDSDLPPS